MIVSSIYLSFRLLVELMIKDVERMINDLMEKIISNENVC